MRKEPFFVYILRLAMLAAIICLLLMLYWSNLLLEENINKIRIELSDLKYDLSTQQHSSYNGSASASIAHTTAAATANRPHIDPSLPNLLTEDLYFRDVLPKTVGKDFKPRGSFRNAVLSKPINLNPFNNLSPAPQLIAYSSDAVSNLEFGKFETLAKGMAIKMEERLNPKTGVPEYWVHLRDHLFWQPLKQEFFGDAFELAPMFKQPHPVTAEDFKFYIDAIFNPYNQLSGALAMRTAFDSLDEIVIVDPLTFIVRWKAEEVTDAAGKKTKKIKYLSRFLTGGLRPLASFVYKYFSNGKKIISNDSSPDAYRTNSVWAQNFTEHWAQQILVCCGPWLFDGITDRQLKLTRNPRFYNPLAALAENTVFEFTDSNDAALQAFKANQIDQLEVPADKLAEMKDFMLTEKYREQQAKGAGISELSYVGRRYYFVGWNQVNPLFSNAKVRRALTMAIDRNRIIQQFFNGRGILTHGTFYVHSKENDPDIIPWPYDPQAARRILEEEGWFDRDGDGVIDKEINGKQTPFRFSLKYYVKSPPIKAVCEFIATSLKEIGIACELDGIDVADFTTAFEDKAFDALYMAWIFGTPPDDPRQLWHSSGAKEKGSSNFIGFVNPQIDTIIDKLDFEYNQETRLALYRQFDRIIHEEQPYTFIYTPKDTLFYRDYLKNVFIPAERQDLIPGATIGEPSAGVYYLAL